MPEPDPDAIRATWRWLAHAPHGVGELRVIRPGGELVGLGFFDDEAAFVDACVRANAHGNVYVGIQPRPRSLFERSPNRLHGTRRGAKAEDIGVVTATVIDLDPVRATGTASTDGELAAALDVARRTTAACVADGFAGPRIVMSGNGAQLWFAVPPIALTRENRVRVQAGLRAFEASIRQRFQTDQVRVDSIHDLARIIKVAGTVSRKGSPTPERPHRASCTVEGDARVEDSKLAELLMDGGAPIARTVPPARSLPVLRPDSTPPSADRSRASATCSPVQRLFAEGHADRSLALFNVIRWLAHQGQSLDEIAKQVIAWDVDHGNKLAGRDAAAYIAAAHAKIVATADADGSIAPPCKSLQKIGFCPVNNDPVAKCELTQFSLEEWKQGGAASRGSRSKSTDAAPLSPSHALKQESLKGALFVRNGRYCTQSVDGRVVAISSFVLTPTVRLETDCGASIIADARAASGRLVRDVRLPLSAFASRRELLRALPSVDLQWMGTDDNVQALLHVLSTQPATTRHGRTSLGAQIVDGRPIWLLPDRALDASGPIADPPIVHVPSGSTIDRRLRFESCNDAAFRAVAKIVFEHLSQVNTPEVALPMLGWFFATPLKPALMRLVGSFPTLFVWGTQGSGKTCLVNDIFWPLFGVPESEPFSATETEFALVKLLSSTTSIPIFIDEYKPFDMPKHRLASLHRVVRRLYRGETEERGRADLRVTAFDLTAPLCIAGETRPDEAAILERLITANPSKQSLDRHPQHRDSFRALRAAPLHFFAERYVQFCLGRDVAADLRVARTVTESLIGDRNVPLRIADNLAIMLLGVHLFAEFARALGFLLPRNLGAREAVDAVLADVAEQDCGVKNALDAFVEMLSVMAIQGELVAQRHYRLDGGRLLLHVESAYDVFRAHCKHIGYEGEIVDLRVLRRLAQEKLGEGGYVVATSDRACFGDRTTRRRVMVIDLTKTTLVSLDDFAPEPGS